MKVYECEVRVSRNGEYENTETYYVEIAEDTHEDDLVEALMDEIRPEISGDYDGDDDWENGDIDWELNHWDD